MAMRQPCFHCGETWVHGHTRRRFWVSLEGSHVWKPMCAQTPPSVAIRFVRDLEEEDHRFIPEFGHTRTFAVLVSTVHPDQPCLPLRWVVDTATEVTRSVRPDHEQHEAQAAAADDAYIAHLMAQQAVEQGASAAFTFTGATAEVKA